MANFLNPGKPRQFNLQTRYYDPKKEHQKMKEKKAAGNDEEYNEYRREMMRSEWRTHRLEEKRAKTQKRLIIYVILAGLLVALLLLL